MKAKGLNENYNQGVADLNFVIVALLIDIYLILKAFYDISDEVRHIFNHRSLRFQFLLL